MKVTLKDIAQKAGVSIATVSRVINDDKNNPVSEKTQKIVWKIVKEMGYREDNNSTKNKLSKSIGYIINEMPDLIEHPYFSELIKGIEKGIEKYGYDISFSYMKKDLDNMATFHKIIAEEEADGLILIADHIDKGKLEELKKRYQNIVIIGHIQWETNTDMIFIDGTQAVYDAVTFLVNLGHEEIGFIGGNIFDAISLQQEERYKGYEKALKQAGIPIKDIFVENGNWTIKGGYEAMKRILDSGKYPTAIFGASDLMSIGAMRVILEYDIKIPEDISIISFDNIQMAEYTHPSLTTIHIPKKELGIIGVMTLINRIEGELNLPQKIILPTKLIKRESIINSR